MEYPEEWNQLPRHERKKKIKKLKKQQQKKAERRIKIRNTIFMVIVLIVSITGLFFFGRKSPEEKAFEEKVKTISLEDRVEEFDIEGRDHVGQDEDVSYDTNPPTSGAHLSNAKKWGIYDEEIDDKAAVHGLEHGGIWISYKDIDEETKKIFEELGKENSGSVIVSPRGANDDKIAIASWGRMMRLEEPDKALIQKYIDTYKNDSPEKLAR